MIVINVKDKKIFLGTLAKSIQTACNIDKNVSICIKENYLYVDINTELGLNTQKINNCIVLHNYDQAVIDEKKKIHLYDSIWDHEIKCLIETFKELGIILDFENFKIVWEIKHKEIVPDNVVE